MAMLSKEAAVTLPFALVLWGLFFGRRGESGRVEGSLRRRSIAIHLPFWLILAVFLFAGWQNPTYGHLARTSFAIRSAWENVLTQVNVVPVTLSLFVLPSRLNFDHDLRVYHSVLEWPTPLSLALLCGLVLWAVIGLGGHPRRASGSRGSCCRCCPPTVSCRATTFSASGICISPRSAFPVRGPLAVRLADRAAVPRQAAPARVRRRRTSPMALAVPASTVLHATPTYASQVTLWEDVVESRRRRPGTRTPWVRLLRGRATLQRAMDES